MQGIVLDLGGDGLNLGGRITGSNWTEPGDDDAFLLIDATSLRAAGFGDILGAGGTPLQGDTQLCAGLQIRLPGSANATAIKSGWHLLSLLDSNKDGKISRLDNAWAHFRLFTDQNADGVRGAGESKALTAAGVMAISLGSSAPRIDKSGNTVSTGTFTRTDGREATMTDVSFAR